MVVGASKLHDELLFAKFDSEHDFGSESKVQHFTFL